MFARVELEQISGAYKASITHFSAFSTVSIKNENGASVSIFIDNHPLHGQWAQRIADAINTPPAEALPHE